MSLTLSAEDAVLAIIASQGGSVKGKTVIQKLAYFLSVVGGGSLGFAPHFYGPFSKDIEGAVDWLVIDKDIEESSQVIGVNSDGFPIRHFEFALTEQGEKHAEQLLKENGHLSERANWVVYQLGDFGKKRAAKPLSLAAKIHYVLTSKGRPLTNGEIATASKELGWDVTDFEIGRAIELLSKLDLVTVSKP